MSADRWTPAIRMPQRVCRLWLRVVSVTAADPLVADVDDDEARLEGFADRAAFLELWQALHPTPPAELWRVEFRRLAAGGNLDTSSWSRKPVGMLFSAPMVRAVLEGRKTVTRRASVRCRPGDVVWGRETWRERDGVVEYRADGEVADE